MSILLIALSGPEPSPFFMKAHSFAQVEYEKEAAGF